MKKFLILGALCCASTLVCASHIVVNTNISTNTTWTANNTYSLDGVIAVDSGITLTIEAGVTICSGSGSGLVIQSTAKLIADGKADSMIVFTSDQAPGFRNPGDWMGILWLGDAVNNDGVGVIKTFGGATFIANGITDSYNGGSMRYTIIEYAGQTVSGDDVKGGLIAQSLGTGTTLDHLQVLNSVSNGMQINGGIFTTSDLYFQNNYDCDLYISEGNRSSISQLLAIKSPATLVSLPLTTKGITILNNINNPTNTPLTNPIIDGYTLIGPIHCGARTNESSIGMQFDENGGGTFRNGVISDYNVGLEIRDDYSSYRTNDTNMVTFKYEYTTIVNNNTDLNYIPTNWIGCYLGSINSWFPNGCENNGNTVGSLILDYDASICNDYCNEAPLFKVGIETEIEEGDEQGVLRGMLQHDPKFTWVQVCPQTTCQSHAGKAKQSIPLQVYPNPSKEQVLIRIPAELANPTVLQVVDMVTGHQFSYTLPSHITEYRMDISQWTSGFYKIYIIDTAVLYEGRLQVILQ